MENWLAERDEKGNPKYELSVLLEPTPELVTEADMRAHNQKVLDRLIKSGTIPTERH